MDFMDVADASSVDLDNDHSAKFEKTIGTKIFISDAKVDTADQAKLDYEKMKWVGGSCATNEISFTGGQKSDIDVTALCSQEQEVTNGLAAPAEVTLARNWTRDDGMLEELETAYDDNEVRAFKVIFPSGNGFQFLAEIRQSSWSVAVAGKVSASYTLRLRGRPKKILTTTANPTT
ncbi:phage tail tube protein [Enterobacter huaxiensis]|uniref:phage tail tube protein n=1 Tax=Enterobacter huaxiensis TaxID=2494702 RepID=UPI002175A53E|nr:phage tail tube protein [Enterobacter huaxiensis]MCS5452497.1 phage tail protein [Enterobacter huaxiensis]